MIVCWESLLCQLWNERRMCLMSVVECVWIWIATTPNVWLLKLLSPGIYFRVCAFYNPNEGAAISLENFERSLQQIGGYTSSHNFLDSKRHELPWIWLEAQLPISNVSFPRPNLKTGWLSWRSWLSLTYNQSCMGVINVLDFLMTNSSLIIKTQVIRGISDRDGVFVEGINITATLNKQKRRMVPLYRKTDSDALKNICRLCCALYCLWTVNKWLFVV